MISAAQSPVKQCRTSIAFFRLQPVTGSITQTLHLLANEWRLSGVLSGNIKLRCGDKGDISRTHVVVHQTAAVPPGLAYMAIQHDYIDLIPAKRILPYHYIRA